jgi:hypothetical protein
VKIGILICKTPKIGKERKKKSVLTPNSSFEGEAVKDDSSVRVSESSTERLAGSLWEIWSMTLFLLVGEREEERGGELHTWAKDCLNL